MIECDIKSYSSNEALMSLRVGNCDNCISDKNAQDLIKKFKNSDINAKIYKSILDVSVDYPEVIIDCHKENEKPYPLIYKLKATSNNK